MTDLQKRVLAELAKDRLRVMYNRCEAWCGATGICDVCLQKTDCDKLRDRGIR